jgi:hypothetical protein
MASLPSLAGFMNSIVKVDPHEEIKQYERMVYLFSKEFNWSLSDFNSAPIPLILSLLDIREDAMKQEEAANKKAMRKR